MAGSTLASREGDAVESSGRGELSREKPETAQRRTPPGESDERGTRLTAQEHVNDDERREREPGDHVKVERRVRERPIERHETRRPREAQPRCGDGQPRGREPDPHSRALDAATQAQRGWSRSRLCL